MSALFYIGGYFQLVYQSINAGASDLYAAALR